MKTEARRYGTRLLAALAALPLALALTTCKSPLLGLVLEEVAEAVTPPELSAVYPTEEATEVPINAELSITFSKNIDSDRQRIACHRRSQRRAAVGKYSVSSGDHLHATEAARASARYADDHLRCSTRTANARRGIPGSFVTAPPGVAAPASPRCRSSRRPRVDDSTNPGSLVTVRVCVTASMGYRPTTSTIVVLERVWVIQRRRAGLSARAQEAQTASTARSTAVRTAPATSLTSRYRDVYHSGLDDR
ncbi:MAG: Ig-like domain-containing protein [Spirochaetaceae bacterium]|nr:Ig-like domain-containing protein [Spirochaetaceae bacterium]